MIKVTGFRYCRLGTADLEEAVKFATEIIGLELVGQENGFAYMRGDDRDHNIVYFQGDPNDHTVGLELDTFVELDAAESNLKQLGLEVHRGSDEEAAARRCMGYINFKDNSGNSIDLTVRPAQGRCRSSTPALRRISSVLSTGSASTVRPPLPLTVVAVNRLSRMASSAASIAARKRGETASLSSAGAPPAGSGASGPDRNPAWLEKAIT